MDAYANQSCQTNAPRMSSELRPGGLSLGAKNGQSPMEQAIDRLGAVNSQLSDELKALETRLAPILMNAPPTVNAAGPQPSAPLPGSSETVERLCHQADRIFQAIIVLRDIRDRLEV